MTENAVAELPVAASTEVDCQRCDKVFNEIINTFRIAIDEMQKIAAAGKGQEYESQNNPQYNRYFGCAIAMDTLLREYFLERLPQEMQERMRAEATAKTEKDLLEKAPVDVAN
jgi:hypothetical protein